MPRFMSARHVIEGPCGGVRDVGVGGERRCRRRVLAGGEQRLGVGVAELQRDVDGRVGGQGDGARLGAAAQPVERLGAQRGQPRALVAAGGFGRGDVDGGERGFATILEHQELGDATMCGGVVGRVRPQLFGVHPRRGKVASRAQKGAQPLVEACRHRRALRARGGAAIELDGAIAAARALEPITGVERGVDRLLAGIGGKQVVGGAYDVLFGQRATGCEVQPPPHRRSQRGERGVHRRPAPPRARRRRVPRPRPRGRRGA